MFNWNIHQIYKFSMQFKMNKRKDIRAAQLIKLIVQMDSFKVENYSMAFMSIYVLLHKNI